MKLSKEYNVDAFVLGSIDENSRAIGKKNKAIIGIVDENFSKAITRLIIGGDAIGQEGT